MKDTEFYQRLLELREPWQVQEVKLDIVKRKVEVVLECRATAWGDPATGGRAHVHGYEPRQWRHLDTMQFETVLTARVPRVKYADGRTELVAVPWAQPHGRFTLLFEAWAIQVLIACHSVSAACELLRLNWETAQHLMDRAVERGLARRDLRGLARLGIDEKSFGRGQDYISVLSDVDRGRVLEVVPGREQASAELLLETVPEAQRPHIQAVAMDMSRAFAAAVKAQLPEADIVYDRFHVSALLNAAVDEVRRAEHKRLQAEGDESLKGTRQLWLFNPRNLEDDRLENLANLAECNFKTSRAWLQKENFEGFWTQESRWSGEGYLRKWYNSAIHCRLEPIKRAARTIKKHAEGLLNYFDHHISNAVAEGLNSRIQAIKSAARGFRNFENYRTRILFFCGKLQLAPAGAP
jgi:transposase